MNKSKRKIIIAGNWKMNETSRQAVRLIEEIKSKLSPAPCKVVLCVPAIDIPAATKAVEGSIIEIGGQNCHWEKSGAYTGEISRGMLTEFGVKYCVIGHSERRQYFGETDETVNKRSKACISSGITPIICVGENLSQREEGITEKIIGRQIEKDLEGFEKDDLQNTVIAYEPIWAIGTGKTATAGQAEEVCAFIRDIISRLSDQDTADKMSILYGGSMNAKNAADLLAMEDIDGGLIGGASLKADDFTQIVRYTK